MTDPCVLVVTVSDRSSTGAREDRSGQLAVRLLSGLGWQVSGPVVVPDEVVRITEALRRAVADGFAVVITTGGTGLGPRDVTPEATGAVIDRLVPGVAEIIRARGIGAGVSAAALSRGIVGVMGSAFVVNLPGSTGGVRDGIDAVAPILRHAVEQIAGGDHAPEASNERGQSR